MNDDKDDTRPQRTWFLQKEGSRNWSSASESPLERYALIQGETKEEDKKYEIVTRIFLSHTPLTFGHSQVIMKCLGLAGLKTGSRLKITPQLVVSTVFFLFLATLI